jgi:hypothetical protein
MIRKSGNLLKNNVVGTSEEGKVHDDRSARVPRGRFGVPALSGEAGAFHFMTAICERRNKI